MSTNLPRARQCRLETNVRLTVYRITRPSHSLVAARRAGTAGRQASHVISREREHPGAPRRVGIALLGSRCRWPPRPAHPRIRHRQRNRRLPKPTALRSEPDARLLAQANRVEGWRERLTVLPSQPWPERMIVLPSGMLNTDASCNIHRQSISKPTNTRRRHVDSQQQPQQGSQEEARTVRASGRSPSSSFETSDSTRSQRTQSPESQSAGSSSMSRRQRSFSTGCAAHANHVSASRSKGIQEGPKTLCMCKQASRAKEERVSYLRGVELSKVEPSKEPRLAKRRPA